LPVPAAVGGPDPGQADPGQDRLEELSRLLESQGALLLAADLAPPEATLYVSQSRYRQIPRAIGRVARAAAAVLPFAYERFRIVLVDGGVEVLSASLPRASLEQALDPFTGTREELWLRTGLAPPPLTLRAAEHRTDTGRWPDVDGQIVPALRQTIGRPEAFVLYQVWLRLLGSVAFSPETVASGGIGIDLYNNFDRIRVPSNSVLPRVRSDIAEYLKEGSTGITHLQISHSAALAPDWYGQVYAGLLEEMFGGVGAEVLYRPFGADWAVGLDVNWARQRETDMLVDFRDYQVLTGHLTGYLHLPGLDLDVRLMAGRYLAGDWGATFDLSRQFDSGIRVGAFATLTDVPAEQFGEGRFDKGIYVQVPLDQLYVKSVRGALGWLWRPLTRDGGQTLALRRRLIATTGAAGMAGLRRDWPSVLD